MNLNSGPINEPLRIIFMGTPHFAVPTLQGLIESEEKVILVVSQPDRPKGRSKKPVFPPVKELALKYGGEIVQPDTIRSESFLSQIRSANPDLIVVAAYGKIIPPGLLGIPRLGCINVHGSLLPKYRGAAPIHWAIIQGETATGITTMLMDAGLDTGDILLKKELEIGETETAGELHDRMAELGKSTLLETLRTLRLGALTSLSQDDSQATFAPPLKKEDGKVDWSKPAREIFNRIRGMNPWPGAYAFLGERLVKIHRSTAFEGAPSGDPGTILEVAPEVLKVAAGMGYLTLEEIQLQGGKRMGVAEFLRGHRLAAGDRLS